MRSVLLLLRISLPLSLLLFLWVTVKTVMVSGEETGVGFGFLLSWHTPSVFSMETNIALVPMLVDFLLYFGFVHALCHFTLRRLTIKKYLMVSSVVLLWPAAILSVALCAIVLSYGGGVYIFELSDYFDGHDERSRTAVFGLLPRE
jgi:hypothetical protein